MKRVADFDSARAFHGHLGPNLVIGIKLGNHANRVLQPESCFQLRAQVFCPAEPPVSCMIDGVQFSTGCTMGKKNIEHVVSDDEVKVVFTNTNTGGRLCLRVDTDFIAQSLVWYKEKGEDEASRMTWDTPDPEVFSECEA